MKLISKLMKIWVAGWFQIRHFDWLRQRRSIILAKGVWQSFKSSWSEDFRPHFFPITIFLSVCLSLFLYPSIPVLLSLSFLSLFHSFLKLSFSICSIFFLPLALSISSYLSLSHTLILYPYLSLSQPLPMGLTFTYLTAIFFFPSRSLSLTLSLLYSKYTRKHAHSSCF